MMHPHEPAEPEANLVQAKRYGVWGIGNAMATVICLGLVGAGIYLWFQRHIGHFYLPRFIIAFEIPVVLLFLWLAAGSWRAARRPTDWLLRIQGNDVLIKFRSFQNWRMSEDDPQVIVLHRDEIAFVHESLKKLPGPEQHKRLAQLASRDPLTATETARVLYNCSLSDARQLVEQLMAANPQKLS
jgi:hypothetical protein